MTIKSENNELIIRIPENLMGLSEIQELIDYLKFKSITSKSKAKAGDAEKLADEINQSWWNKNKNKYIN